MSITLKDIAMKAGVSQMTVSRILNGKARGQVSPEVAARVQEIAGELKYRSNRIDRKLDSFLAGDASAAELPRITVLTLYPDFLERGGGAAGRLNAILPSVFQTAAEAGGMVEILPVTKENDPNRIEWPWLNRFGTGSRILALSPWFLVPLAELSRRGARIALIQGEEFWRNMTLRYAAEWAILTYRNRQGYEMLAEELRMNRIIRRSQAFRTSLPDMASLTCIPLSRRKKPMMLRHSHVPIAKIHSTRSHLSPRRELNGITGKPFRKIFPCPTP